MSDNATPIETPTVKRYFSDEYQQEVQVMDPADWAVVTVNGTTVMHRRSGLREIAENGQP